MRRCLVLLPVCALVLTICESAHAQEQSKANPPPSAHNSRLTWQEHFAQANLAHDGHLTLEEAKAGYPTIARKFHVIDIDGKGYVTENDIRAWRALAKTAHPKAQEADDTLRPRHAFQLSYPGPQPLNTSTTHIVLRPAEHLQVTDTLPEPE